MRALWNGAVLAESETTVQVEGNHYFAPDTVRHDYLRESGTHTTCAWKGTASYYTLVVDGQENPDAASYYPHPTAAAEQIRDHVAFWHGVRIEDDGGKSSVGLLSGLRDRLPGR